MRYSLSQELLRLDSPGDSQLSHPLPVSPELFSIAAHSAFVQETPSTSRSETALSPTKYVFNLGFNFAVLIKILIVLLNDGALE